MCIYIIYIPSGVLVAERLLSAACARKQQLAGSFWLHQVQPQVHQPHGERGGEREDSACLLRCCLACWYGRILRWWCPCPTPLRAPSPNQSNQSCTRASLPCPGLPDKRSGCLSLSAFIPAIRFRSMHMHADAGRTATTPSYALAASCCCCWLLVSRDSSMCSPAARRLAACAANTIAGRSNLPSYTPSTVESCGATTGVYMEPRLAVDPRSIYSLKKECYICAVQGHMNFRVCQKGGLGFLEMNKSLLATSIYSLGRNPFRSLCKKLDAASH
jgi:hypothetical protein